MASGDTKTQQYLDVAANGTRADLPSDTCCETRTQTLIRGVAERIMDVEDEVERLENNPDVVDIVATYADLQTYDTQHLTDKDVIRVLQDETHDGDSTYYRYNKQTDAWTYIGESKQYTDFVGTDGTTAGASGLVPAPATTDADKYLKSDGTWDTVQAGPTVVQTTGTSTTDVMSQNAVTSMVYADPSTKGQICIGANATSSGGTSDGGSVAIGRYANALGTRSVCITTGGNSSNQGWAQAIESIAIGTNAITGNSQSQFNGNGSVAIGAYAEARGIASVAFGAGASATQQGEMNIGDNRQFSVGYNNSKYRLLTGLYDPQSDHDAATKGYVDTAVASAAANTISSQDWGDLWQ